MIVSALIKGIIFVRKKSPFQIHPAAGGCKSVPDKEKRRGSDEKEKVTKKPKLKFELKSEHKS